MRSERWDLTGQVMGRTLIFTLSWESIGGFEQRNYIILLRFFFKKKLTPYAGLKIDFRGKGQKER